MVSSFASLNRYLKHIIMSFTHLSIITHQEENKKDCVCMQFHIQVNIAKASVPLDLFHDYYLKVETCLCAFLKCNRFFVTSILHA